MEKPFIKLFRSPNANYFYDVGKNDIIRIPEKVYIHLHAVLSGTSVLEHPDDNDVLPIIESLIELGYLSVKRPERIKHSATEMVPLLLNRCIDKITLQLTQECNFRCKYCIYSEKKNHKQRSHANHNMTIDTAKKAILFYRSHAIDSSIYNVGLYGGEPLLRWNLIKEIILFAEAELGGKLLTFSLTTNASLITEPMAAFLEEHNVSVLVSMDGIKQINDANRVFQDGHGTTDVVLANLQMIHDRHPKLFADFQISSVITPETDPTLFSQFPYELNDIPIESYMMSIEDNTDHDVVLPADLRKTMENLTFQAFLSELGLFSQPLTPYGYGQVKSLQNKLKAIKITNGMQEVTSPSGPCIPGKTRLFITVDGRLFPCERVNETDEYCIGSLDVGLDTEKAKKMLNIGSITEEACKQCWAMRHCIICCKYFDYSSENAAVEKLKHCNSVRLSAEKTIRAAIMLSEMKSFYKDIVN